MRLKASARTLSLKMSEFKKQKPACFTSGLFSGSSSRRPVYRLGSVDELNPRNGSVVPREGRVEPEPRCPRELPIKSVRGFSCPMYKPGFPGARGIWRFSVTSQTGLFSSDGKEGFAFFSG